MHGSIVITLSILVKPLSPVGRLSPGDSLMIFKKIFKNTPSEQLGPFRRRCQHKHGQNMINPDIVLLFLSGAIILLSLRHAER